MQKTKSDFSSVSFRMKTMNSSHRQTGSGKKEINKLPMSQVKSSSFISSATRDSAEKGAQNTHRSGGTYDISPAEFSNLTPMQMDGIEFCFETIADGDIQPFDTAKELRNQASQKFEQEEISFEQENIRKKLKQSTQIFISPAITQEESPDQTMKAFDVMQNRWMKQLFDSLPNVDIKDLLKPRGTEVQFDA